MKLLVWHCKYLRYQDKRKSNRPAGIEDHAAAPVSESFTDVLAAFVSIERGDGTETIPAAVDELRKLSRLMKREDVVVVPFAHLSSDLMKDGAVATALLKLLTKEIGEAGFNVVETSFAYHKDFELHFAAMGHTGAVAFRQVPNALQANEPVPPPNMQREPAVPDIPQPGQLGD